MFKTSVNWIEEGKYGRIKCSAINHYDHKATLEESMTILSTEIDLATKHAQKVGAHVERMVGTITINPNYPKWDSRKVKAA